MYTKFLDLYGIAGARAGGEVSKQEDSGNNREQSPPSALDLGEQFAVMDVDSALFLGTGADANLAPCTWLGHRNVILARWGLPSAETHPDCARFVFRHGYCVVDIPIAIAGGHAKSAALAIQADIPAPLCEGAVEALGGRLDFPRNISTSRGRGVDVPFKLNCAGHYVPSVAASGKGQSKSGRGPTSPADYFEWGFSKKRRNLDNGGLPLPYEEDGLYQIGLRALFRPAKR